ncbi:S8 family peptidase [Nesterenkonia aurantiaca]|uniref:Subtilase family protein n=1 Tax=Nesterenkonia aurantiaca TaxID=1436010 RepID=A0A4R7G561_9MICC|nr:S8 family serine peptidase [Nesterenkonia aurantiaca]TDS86433.1 subtilase family protein [Nesterenkonia aurantiaca]
MTVGSRALGAALALGLGLSGMILAAPASHADEWRDQQYWLEDYGITEAWETTRGEGMTIAVIDTGVDSGHPTLSGAVVGGTDVSGAGDGGAPVGQVATEHGTLVASLAAGRGTSAQADAVAALVDEDVEDLDEDEWADWWEDFEASLEEIYGEDWQDEVDAEARSEFEETRTAPRELTQDADPQDGVIGVAPEASLLSVSLLLQDPNPYGGGTEEQIAEAVTWAVDNGADIINMSLGSGFQEWPEAWDEAFLYAEQNDVLVVAASGNRASGHLSVGAPATIPGVLAVAGVDESREISADSSSQGIAIGIAAASEPLVGAMPGDDYMQWNGTSGASPIVAGAAALVWAANPELSAQEVKHRVLSTADSEGAEGVDPEYGHGVLDVAEAVSGDVPAFETAQYPTLAEWVRVHRRGEVEPTETDEIPEDAGVVAGPEGEPRAMPEPGQPSTAQDWAGPVAVGAAAMLVVAVLTMAVIHYRLVRRQEQS